MVSYLSLIANKSKNTCLVVFKYPVLQLDNTSFKSFPAYSAMRKQPERNSLCPGIYIISNLTANKFPG